MNYQKIRRGNIFELFQQNTLYTSQIFLMNVDHL